MTEKRSPLIRSAQFSDIAAMEDIYWRALQKENSDKVSFYQKNRDSLMLAYAHHIQETFEKKNTLVFMVEPFEKERKAEAYITFSVVPDDRSVRVEDLYNASKEYKLGAPLVNKAIDVAQQLAINTITVCAVSGAQKAYERMGFEIKPNSIINQYSCTMIRDTATYIMC